MNTELQQFINLPDTQQNITETTRTSHENDPIERCPTD